MITLYIAGPMSGHDDYNRPAFYQAAAQLRAAGYHVISPAETPQPTATPEWADWTRASLKRMLDADAVALLPGFSKSRGASLEVHVAVTLGMDHRSITYWIDRAWIHAPRSHNGPEKLTPHFSLHQDGRIEQHLPVGGEDQAQRTPPPIPAATAAAARQPENHDYAYSISRPGRCYVCDLPEYRHRPDHRHLYIGVRPTCVECGATDPNTDPTHQEDN